MCLLCLRYPTEPWTLYPAWIMPCVGCVGETRCCLAEFYLYLHVLDGQGSEVRSSARRRVVEVAWKLDFQPTGFHYLASQSRSTSLSLSIPPATPSICCIRRSSLCIIHKYFLFVVDSEGGKGVGAGMEVGAKRSEVLGSQVAPIGTA